MQKTLYKMLVQMLVEMTPYEINLLISVLFLIFSWFLALLLLLLFGRYIKRKNAKAVIVILSLVIALPLTVPIAIFPEEWRLSDYFFMIEVMLDMFELDIRKSPSQEPDIFWWAVFFVVNVKVFKKVRASLRRRYNRR